ncbi:MAG: hypothetical protein KGJ59_14660 [Bacteroidota bacterium]|nr:hypothetical protein [Bacteroidota bacterium]
MKTAVVTPTSQVEKLKLHMSEKGVTHAEEIRADIPGVRIGEGVYAEGVTALQKIAGKAPESAPIFFCNIAELNIRKILKKGDGGAIPDQAVIRGLNVETAGRFDLINARIFSNGSINVIVDEETAVVPMR